MNMGTLRDFDPWRFDCNVYFETGTGHGFSLTYALASDRFDFLYSVEIDAETFQRAEMLFGVFPKLQLIHSDSASALRATLPSLSGGTSILFFLDAHFPGETSSSFAGYKADVPEDLRLPLHAELQLIRDLRPHNQDVIIVDDLRIYEDGPYEAGNMPGFQETLAKEQKNIDFVHRIFPERTIERDYRRQGFLLILP